MADHGINLGVDPETLRVHLTTGADFYTVLVLQGGTFPAGATLHIEVNGATNWDATIDGAEATFSVDKAVADTIADKTPVRLVFADGSHDEVWATGTVVRHG